MADQLHPVHFVRILESQYGAIGYGMLRGLCAWDELTYLITQVARPGLAPSSPALCSGDETSTVLATGRKPWEEP